MVDKELKEEKETALSHKDEQESILVDMILHQIANYCVDGCDNKSNVRTDDKEDAGVNESRVVLVTEDPFIKKNDSGIAVTGEFLECIVRFLWNTNIHYLSEEGGHF